MKKMLKILAFTYAIIFIIISYQFKIINPRIPDTFKRVNEKIFSIEIPVDSKLINIDSGNWKGFRLDKYENFSIWYRKITLTENNAALFNYTKTLIKNIKYEKELSLHDGGLFVLSAYGKSSRNYIYLIRAGGYLYWIEGHSRNSTLLSYKHFTDKLALSLNVNNIGTNKRHRDELTLIDKNIFRYSQSSEIIYVFFTLLLVVSLLITCAVLYYSGKIPKKITDKIILSEAFVYLKIKKTMSFKLKIGAAVLTENSFSIYVFGKKLLTVSKGELSKITFDRNKEKIIFKEAKMVISMEVKDFDKWNNSLKTYTELQSKR